MIKEVNPKVLIPVIPRNLGVCEIRNDISKKSEETEVGFIATAAPGKRSEKNKWFVEKDKDD